MSSKGYPGSPWLVPPEKAPKMGVAILVVVLGFVVLFGGLIFNLISILGGRGFDFALFFGIIMLGTLLIILGSILFAKSFAARKYSAFLNAHNLKVCPHCGKPIPKDARVCPYCGKSVEEANVK